VVPLVVSPIVRRALASEDPSHYDLLPKRGADYLRPSTTHDAIAA
jgi:hypothetical protein